MKKLKKILLNNGSLTLLSIISLILVFVFVCLIVLSIIYKAGIIDSSFFLRAEETTQGSFYPSADEENVEPGYTALDSEENFKKLLASFPYYDDFYAEFYVTYVYEALYNVEFYRIYKNGGRYRIETYDMQNNLAELILCDGTRVSVTNKEGHTASYPVSDDFTIAKQAALPSFLFYENGEYTLIEYTEEGGICTVTCEYPSLGTTDVVSIDMETGIMKSSITSLGGKVIMFYDIMDFETECVFGEDVFIVR